MANVQSVSALGAEAVSLGGGDGRCGSARLQPNRQGQCYCTCMTPTVVVESVIDASIIMNFSNMLFSVNA